ncbi:MAG: hypothetical protein HQL27_01175 [Candidatus Omnitrophica bacterium]|nr:hypothetical protein [Candidatus Omnitrophota bacterium]
MQKMVMITYNESIDAEVMEALEISGLSSYTKIPGVLGKGNLSGTHLGTDVWPGKNNILYIACEEREARQLLTSVRSLRKEIGKEGLKAFVLPLEEQT